MRALTGVLLDVSARLQRFSPVYVRSVIQQLHFGGDGVGAKRRRKQTGVGNDDLHIVLVEGCRILAARDLVELGVFPGAVGRVRLRWLRWLRRTCLWCGRCSHGEGDWGSGRRRASRCCCGLVVGVARGAD